MLWEISKALDLSCWDSELFSDGSLPAVVIYRASATLRRWPLVRSDYAGRGDLLGLQPPLGRDEVLMPGRYPHGVESRGAGDRDGQETLGQSLASLDSSVDNRNTMGDVGRNTSG